MCEFQNIELCKKMPSEAYQEMPTDEGEEV